MLVSFTKEEFHELIMLYLLEVLDDPDNNPLLEGQPEWSEFLDFIRTRQMKSHLQQNRTNLSMKIRTLGKTVVERLDKQEPDTPVKLMI